MADQNDDLNSHDEEVSKKPAHEILREEIIQGMKSLENPPFRVFVSGISAGLKLGCSLLVMAVVLTLVGESQSRLVRELLLANAYTIGFLFVVLGRSELFTEQTTLAMLPVIHGLAGVGSLARLWALVYAGNVVGTAVFAGATVCFAPALGAVEPHAFTTIAREVTDHEAPVIVVSGVLAGWLMGLLSWLVAASRDTISQMLVVWLITMVIGLVGLHHAVASTAEVTAGVLAVPGIGMADLGRVLLWSSLGNALGGTFFAVMVKYGHGVRKD